MNTLHAKALALLNAVDFDNNGRVVAGNYRGGNGGLISRETIVAADELRKLIATGEFWKMPHDDFTPEQQALAFDFCAEINRAGGIEPGGLLDMAKRLYQAEERS